MDVDPIAVTSSRRRVLRIVPDHMVVASERPCYSTSIIATRHVAYPVNSLRTPFSVKWNNVSGLAPPPGERLHCFHTGRRACLPVAPHPHACVGATHPVHVSGPACAERVGVYARRLVLAGSNRWSLLVSTASVRRSRGCTTMLAGSRAVELCVSTASTATEPGSFR